MKAKTLLIASLVLAGIAMTSCKKDDEPAEEKKIGIHEINTTVCYTKDVVDNCNIEVTYVDDNGKTVTETLTDFSENGEFFEATVEMGKRTLPYTHKVTFKATVKPGLVVSKELKVKSKAVFEGRYYKYDSKSEVIEGVFSYDSSRYITEDKASTYDEFVKVIDELNQNTGVTLVFDKNGHFDITI